VGEVGDGDGDLLPLAARGRGDLVGEPVVRGVEGPVPVVVVPQRDGEGAGPRLEEEVEEGAGPDRGVGLGAEEDPPVAGAVRADVRERGVERERAAVNGGGVLDQPGRRGGAAADVNGIVALLKVLDDDGGLGEGPGEQPAVPVGAVGRV